MAKARTDILFEGCEKAEKIESMSKKPEQPQKPVEAEPVNKPKRAYVQGISAAMWPNHKHRGLSPAQYKRFMSSRI